MGYDIGFTEGIGPLDSQDEAVREACPWPIYRLSVDRYHAMIAAGILVSGDPLELLDGWLIRKYRKSRPRVWARHSLREQADAMMPAGWFACDISMITLSTSEPEPDLIIARGDPYEAERYWGAADVAIVGEAADLGLDCVRTLKKTIYARDRVPEYWVVNLVDKHIEVYTEPTGEGDAADYAQRDVYQRGDAIPVALDGVEVGQINVAEVLP